MTSAITLLELLVQPYRDQKEDLAQKIFALTTTYPTLEWVPLTMNLADRAAELRARYRLSTPDGDFKVPGLPFDLNCRVVISFSGYGVYRKEFTYKQCRSNV